MWLTRLWDCDVLRNRSFSFFRSEQTFSPGSDRYSLRRGARKPVCSVSGWIYSQAIRTPQTWGWFWISRWILGVGYSGHGIEKSTEFKVIKVSHTQVAILCTALCSIGSDTFENPAYQYRDVCLSDMQSRVEWIESRWTLLVLKCVG